MNDPRTAMYRLFHLITAAIILVAGQIISTLAFDDGENAHLSLIAQLITSVMLFLYAVQPLLKSEKRQADLRVMDLLLKKIMPICFAGVVIGFISPLLLPVGTFSRNPALHDAVVVVVVSAALLPAYAFVLQLFVILLTRLTKTDNKED